MSEYFVVATLFNVSPVIESVVLSGYTQRRNSAGDMVDDYIFSLAFDRQRFVGIDFKKVDPETFCLGCKSRCLLSTTKVFKSIEPYE